MSFVLVHGHARHRGQRTPTYDAWASMIQRCTNPNYDQWKTYGGRGVVVCERWRKSFAAFLADMGERPPGTRIALSDNSGNFEPGNCFWLSMASLPNRPKLTAADAEQIRQLAANGIKGGEIAARFGVSGGMVSRIVLGRSWKSPR